MLSEQQLVQYKQALQDRQAEITLRFAQTEEMAQPVAPDQALGRLTRQDAIQYQQLTLENRRRMELQRTQLTTALSRIEKGTYGVCVLCKEPIATQRLDIVPESPLCVQCLEKRGR